MIRGQARLARVSLPVFWVVSWLALDLHADETRPTAAVLPVRGTISRNELKLVAVELRAQLRTHGYRLAVQRDVRKAAKRLGVVYTPSRAQMAGMASRLGARLVIASMVKGDWSRGFRLEVVAMDMIQRRLRGVTAKLPHPGAGLFTRAQVRPASAACVAALLEAYPNPVHGPFPDVTRIDVYDFLAPELPAKSPAQGDSSAATAGGASASEDTRFQEPKMMVEPEEELEDARSKWNHEGVFANLSFAIAWCMGDTLCEKMEQGFGARLRFGYRIMSYVAISLAGVVLDHNFPVTANTAELLRVNRGIVWGGVLGGIRYHPVKQMPIDPFVGIDLGYVWMLHTQSEASDQALSAGAPTSPGDTMYRRTTMVLKGFTMGPEAGLQVFIARGVAVSVLAQWVFPFWSNVCARVDGATADRGSESKEVCSSMDKVEDATGMDPRVKATLSDEGERPTFITLEFGLVFQL